MRRGSAAAAILTAMALAAAPGALAATEVGSDCVAENAAPGYTFATGSDTVESRPQSVPAAGVVTRWSVRMNLPIATQVKLRVLSPTGNPDAYQTVAETYPHAVVQGENSFDTRIPVEPGQRFAIYSDSLNQTPFCQLPGTEMLIASTDTSLGSVRTYVSDVNSAAPVLATVEPDADGDGYGDETQDACPQDPRTQETCPVARLAGFAFDRRNSAAVWLTADSALSARVSGLVTIRVPVRTRGRKPARRLLTLRLNGGAKAVRAGGLTRFVLKYPPRLRAFLRSLPRGRSRLLRITAAGADPSQAATSAAFRLKVKGQKRPRRARRR